MQVSEVNVNYAARENLIKKHSRSQISMNEYSQKELPLRKIVAAGFSRV